MSNLFKDNTFSEYPLAGNLPNEEKINLLEAIGDIDTANEIASFSSSTDTKSIFGKSFTRNLKPWEYTSHTFGFLPASPQTKDLLPLYNAGQIKPDKSLRNAAVNIRLDKLRVSDYPGSGEHHILFDFYAQNSLEGNQKEHLRLPVAI